MKKISFSDILLLTCVILAILAIGFISNPNNVILHGISPHPFLVLCLFVAAYYGFQIASITALTCSALYLFILHNQVNYLDVISLASTEFLTLPFTLIFLTPVIGEFTDRLKAKNKEISEDLDVSQISLKQSKISQEALQRQNIELKKKLISKLDTTYTLYENAKLLEAIDEDTLLNNLIGILEKDLESQKLAIFRVTNDVPYFHNGLNNFDEQKFSTSFTEDELYLSLQQEKKIQSRIENNAKIDFPVIYCPILIEGQIKYFIAVYHIPFLNFIPSNLHLMELYSDWCANSLIKNYHFKDLLEGTIIDKNLNLYRYDFFLERIQDEFNRSQTYMIPLSVLKINLKCSLSGSRLFIVIKTIGHLLQEVISRSHYLSFNRDDLCWYAIYPIFNEKNEDKLLLEINDVLSSIDLEDKDLFKTTIKMNHFVAENNQFEELLQ